MRRSKCLRDRAVSGFILAFLCLASSDPFASTETRLGPPTSPDGSRKIFYNDYDPYIQEPAIFSIAETGTGELVHQIHVPVSQIGRFIYRLEWLDDRFVLALGDTIYVTILDAVSGRLAASFGGAEVELSQDRSRFAFRLPRVPRHGPKSPLATDYIGLAWLSDKEGELAWKEAVIHPELVLSDAFEWKEASTDKERHLLEGALVWSDDGQSLAFAERYADRRWLITIDVPEDPLLVSSRRFPMKDQSGEVKDIRWIPGRRTVEVINSSGTTELIEIEAP